MLVTARATILVATLGTLLIGSPASLAMRGADPDSRDLPPALAPFEFLIGRWKGQGVPRDNPSQRFRGWTETHTWAWVFAGGKPVGLTVSIQGGKVFGQGTLRYDPTNKLTVSYQGQNLPICCTGCRDEFNENPEKYIKKRSLKASSGGGTKTDPPKPSRVSRFEDAFSGDVDPAEAKSKTKMADRPSTEGNDAAPAAGEKAGSKPDAKAQAADKLAARAATALRLAQNLEKTGKSAAALKSYKQIIKDYPKTAPARTAAERIKAIEGR
jgi:YHS domain-containing protein